jgi:peroxin-5
MNPYVGHPNPMQEGQELFRKGLLSEAVLALEAEVLKNPDNAEGWRLLGVTHAENDDDQQAIAAMMRAQEANPTNLEVLLALGVSHTNG